MYEFINATTTVMEQTARRNKYQKDPTLILPKKSKNVKSTIRDGTITSLRMDDVETFRSAPDFDPSWDNPIDVDVRDEYNDLVSKNIVKSNRKKNSCSKFYFAK